MLKVTWSYQSEARYHHEVILKRDSFSFMFYVDQVATNQITQIRLKSVQEGRTCSHSSQPIMNVVKEIIFRRDYFLSISTKHKYCERIFIVFQND